MPGLIPRRAVRRRWRHRRTAPPRGTARPRGSPAALAHRGRRAESPAGRDGRRRRGGRPRL